MKIILAIVVCFFAVTGILADDTKYEKAMKKNLTKIDSATNLGAMLDVGY